MKLLHIGLCCQPPPINGMQQAFFDNSDYREINCGEKDLNRKVIELSNSFTPDLIFMQIQTEGIIHRSTIVELKKKGAFIINWTGDIRNQVPQWMIEIADVVDLTCFSNMRDVDWMKKHNYRSEYLEQGYDENIYKPQGEAMAVPPIVYFANNYNNQFPMGKFRIQMNDFLKDRFKKQYGIYGNGWNNANGNFNHSQPVEASAYRGAKIAINVSNYEVKQYSSDRIHRIMGTGTAICLAKHYQDIEKVYTDGVHLRVWEDLNDLEILINYYLRDGSNFERFGITKNGMELAQKNFTFQSMIKNIIALWEQKK